METNLYAMYREQVESLPSWARSRPRARRNAFRQIRLAARALLHFRAVLRHVERMDLQTS